MHRCGGGGGALNVGNIPTKKLNLPSTKEPEFYFPPNHQMQKCS